MHGEEYQTLTAQRGLMTVTVRESPVEDHRPHLQTLAPNCPERLWAAVDWMLTVQQELITVIWWESQVEAPHPQWHVMTANWFALPSAVCAAAAVPWMNLEQSSGLAMLLQAVPVCTPEDHQYLLFQSLEASQQYMRSVAGKQLCLPGGGCWWLSCHVILLAKSPLCESQQGRKRD